jgi:hypothetical protein
MTPCAVEGCGKPARTRGWCPLHYQRWRQHGDVHRRVQGGPRVPPGRDQAIAEARRAGATLAAISVQHGITPERVRQILARAPVENETEVKRVNHDAGCVARGAAVSAAHRARMRQHEQEVAKLYAAGHLSREIAQRIGISRHWVREIRRRLDCPCCARHTPCATRPSLRLTRPAFCWRRSAPPTGFTHPRFTAPCVAAVSRCGAACVSRRRPTADKENAARRSFRAAQIKGSDAQ